MRFPAKQPFLTIGLLSIFSHSIFAGDGQVEAIDQLVKRYSDHEMFTGSVLVASGGKLLYRKSHGLANREWSLPNTPDTRFRIASMSKSFTALLVMNLVEAGLLKTNDKISDHLPNYPSKSGDRISIHQLLTHRSGIPHFIRIPGWFKGRFRQPISDADFLAVIAEMPLSSEPGTTYTYSNSNYFILGAIVEKVTQKPFDQVLRERILEPAGMTQTGHDQGSAILPKRAMGYVMAPGGGYLNEGYINMDVFKASGSLYSTVDDLFKLDSALYGEKLLSNEGKAVMFTPKDSYGWNVWERRLPGSDKVLKVISYNGEIEGFTSMISRFPESRDLVVLLNNNGAGYTVLNALSGEIAAILHGQSPQAEKVPLSFALNKAVMDGKVGAFVAAYQKDKSRYHANEARINVLGYQLLMKGFQDEALAVFELNADCFPNSANAFDSLGEAYSLAGKRERAIESYKKSLALDPKNDNARAMLAKLGDSE